MAEPARKMPGRLDLGRVYQSTIMQAVHTRDSAAYAANGRRTVMGYVLPSWQRPFVWTDTQCDKFIESAWLGLSLGTYSYNQTDSADSPLDGLLIDGQQRMRALERYFDNEFPVFGYRWNEVTVPETRRFQMLTAFPSYVTNSEDENWLRGYYDRMNFGGTAHTEDQRALLSQGDTSNG